MPSPSKAPPRRKSWDQQDWSRFHYLGPKLVELNLLKTGVLEIDQVPADAFQLLLGSKESGDKVRLDCFNRRLSPSIAVQYESHIEVDEKMEVVAPKQQHFYEVQRDTNQILVKIAPPSAGIKSKYGNDLISNYLDETFGEYAPFIISWLAAFCYTNYRRLPLLLLRGDPSSGKSTFASFISAFFPTLTWHWDGAEGSFSPQVEKKLLVIEENEHTGSVRQYKTIKRYLGAQELLCHHKWRKPYMIRSNINLVLTSNNAIAIYVQPEEIDHDATRNKFFVYEFKQPRKLDAGKLGLLKEAAGHYIRTVLWDEYRRIRSDFDKHRFAVPVPMTQELRDLIIANEPVELSIFVDMVLHLARSSEPGATVLKDALLDRGIVTNDAQRRTYKAMMDRSLPESMQGKWRYQLRDAKLIDPSVTRFKVDGRMTRGFRLTDQFLKKYMPECSSFQDLAKTAGATVAERKPEEAENALL